MARPKIVLAAFLLAMIAIVACTPAAANPAASPVLPAAPSAPSTASPQPSVTPLPSAVETPPAAGPSEGLADFTVAERYLLDGVLRGAIDCEPAAGSDDLPRKAVAGIECNSPEPSVARIGFYLFGDDQDMLEAYVFQMKAVGIQLESGSCDDGGGEHSYAPGVDFIVERVGCFLDAEGRANYRALLPGVHVYIGIRGQSDDMRALEDFAWLGNQDTPGNPTLWGEAR
jgi:hypothetical protein